MKLMKKMMLLFTASTLTIASFAQIKAVTTDGRNVILNANGTWEYTNNADPSDWKSVRMNSGVFRKSSNAKQEVKSKIVNASVFLNSSEWSHKLDNKEGVPEWTFTLKGGSAYGMMITEKAVLELETLAGAALINARAVAPDARIVSQELREVNGKKMICLRLDGTIDGTRFSYLGYYYSSKGGTVQLIMYSVSSVFDRYAAQMEEFLNGLVVKG